ncbi:MAG: exosome complex protein Rrp42 [Candidatus Thermoplasmatota archaeon]|jgi:exosome complex component RRP42|nr:exosome complex protein Rrp42 [Candidatus Thermoplasmatota archaeon]MCL5984225.1 exosome complex protein Rrp42 [Candidatus Thermoplasmatota archaeon]
MSNEVSTEILATHVLDLAKSGKRLDGRALDEMRHLHITPGYVTSADGSALVELGDTKVLAGIKLEPGTPFPDTPNAGVLTTNAEIVPIASPEYEPGPPSIQSVELSRVVDRAIRAAEAIDLKGLCVTPGEKCWTCFVDLHILDDSGNLTDAALIAAMAALRNAKLPAERFELGETKPLDVRHFPIETTFVRIGDAIVVDPSSAEEGTCQGRLTIATDEEGNVVAMQKAKVGAFSPQDVAELVERAFVHGNKVRAALGQLG